MKVVNSLAVAIALLVFSAVLGAPAPASDRPAVVANGYDTPPKPHS